MKKPVAIGAQCATSPSPRTSQNAQRPCVADRLRVRIERERCLAAQSPTDAPVGRLVPLNRAAEALGISPWTIRHWCLSGRVRYHRIGRRLLLSEQEIGRIAGSAYGATTTNAGGDVYGTL